MKGFASWLYLFDKEVFMQLRRVLGSTFMENNAGVMGNPWFWMPFFVFLAVLVIMQKPGSGIFSLFFGLGAFILSFQAASILASLFQQPAPYWIEYILHNQELPGFQEEGMYCLPDWGIAAMMGVFGFVRLRLKAWGGINIQYGWIAILIFSIIRIYAGYTYPMGAVMAILLGLLTAWLMFQLARNVEIVSRNNPISPSKADEKGEGEN